MSNVLNLRASLPVQSNAADWNDTIQFRDNGTPLDISAATEISVRVRRQDDRGGRDYGHNHGSNLLEATLTGGTVVKEGSTGVASFSFTKEQMSRLCAGTYVLSVLITSPSATSNPVIGNLPIVEGF